MDNKKDNFHFFFDGYDIAISKLESLKLMSSLLHDINREYLNDTGKSIMIPCFGNKNLLDNGISGIVLGNNFHFTCHTFSKLNSIFVDLYSNNTIDDRIISILNGYFETKKYDLCTDNKPTGKFGKHIIIKKSTIPYQEGLILIDKIIESINMHPIHETISSVYENGYDILRPIAESHVSIHCHKDCIVDVFSCNNFDEEKIINTLNGVENIKTVERGKYLVKEK